MTPYKPPRVGSGGPSGKATVKLGKQGNENAASITFEEDGKRYIIPAKNCPKYIQAGTFFVSLSPQKDAIRGMRPLNGQFKGKVNRFLSQEGKPPVPRTQSASYEGRAYSYQHFAVIVEITQPAKYAGMECFLDLRYNFGETQEEHKGKVYKVVAITSLKSKYTAMLDEFLQATGVWDFGPVEYSDNILPTLQKRVLRNDREFGFTLKDGWIQYIIIPDANELESNNDWADSSDDTKEEPTLEVEAEEEGNGWGSPTIESEDEETEELPWEDV